MSKLQIRKSEKTKAARQPQAKAKTETKAKPAKGACGARVGSRKEQIARVLLDTNSIPKALAKAEALGIKKGTVKSWAGYWKRQKLWTPPAEASEPKS